MQAKKRINTVVAAALFAVLAAAVGILESFLPLQFIIPVPGVKLGIANIVVVTVFSIYGSKTAFAVTIVRLLIGFMFSGNPVSFIIALSGGLLSFAVLFFFMKLKGKVFTYIGISAVCAASHGIGQITAAYFAVGAPVLYYLPCLCFFCALTGVFTGTLLNIISDKLIDKTRTVIYET